MQNFSKNNYINSYKDNCCETLSLILKPIKYKI